MKNNRSASSAPEEPDVNKTRFVCRPDKTIHRPERDVLAFKVVTTIHEKLANDVLLFYPGRIVSTASPVVPVKRQALLAHVGTWQIKYCFVLKPFVGVYVRTSKGMPDFMCD